MSKQKLLSIFALSCLIVFSASCKPKGNAGGVETIPTEVVAPQPKPEPIKEVEEKPIPRAAEEPSKPIRASATEVQRQLSTVYFDLDKSDLTSQTRSTLQKNSEVLKSNSDFDLVVEGHCDERGTIEYNMALGERRANAVRDYMTTLGISRSRMRVRSWGEEKPAARGSGESVWSQNRRAEFTVE